MITIYGKFPNLMRKHKNLIITIISQTTPSNIIQTLMYKYSNSQHKCKLYPFIFYINAATCYSHKMHTKRKTLVQKENEGKNNNDEEVFILLQL